MTEPSFCRRCKYVYNDYLPIRTTCYRCPPVTCKVCKMSDDRVCSCWIGLDSLNFADKKGLLALGDLSIDTPPQTAGMDDE